MVKDFWCPFATTLSWNDFTIWIFKRWGGLLVLEIQTLHLASLWNLRRSSIGWPTAINASLYSSSWAHRSNIILTLNSFQRTSASLRTKPISMGYKHLVLILISLIWVVDCLYTVILITSIIFLRTGSDAYFLVVLLLITGLCVSHLKSIHSRILVASGLNSETVNRRAIADVLRCSIARSTCFAYAECSGAAVSSKSSVTAPGVVSSSMTFLLDFMLSSLWIQMTRYQITEVLITILLLICLWNSYVRLPMTILFLYVNISWILFVVG